MLPLPLINFEIQKYYQNKRRYNGVYSRNSLPKIKDGTYEVNLDKYKPEGTNWIQQNIHILINITYFNYCGLNTPQK